MLSFFVGLCFGVFLGLFPARSASKGEWDLAFQQHHVLRYCQRDNVAYKLPEFFHLPRLKFGWPTGQKCIGGRRPSSWQGDVQGELHEPICSVFLGNRAINMVAERPPHKRHKS